MKRDTIILIKHTSYKALLLMLLAYIRCYLKSLLIYIYIYIFNSGYLSSGHCTGCPRRRSLLRDLIPELILRQKRHIHRGPIGNDSGVMSFWSTVNKVERKEERCLQDESSSLCWLTKGKQSCEDIPSWTQLYCQIYKYLNYMFRPLWPSSGWIRNQMKNYIYTILHINFWGGITECYKICKR